MLNQTQVEHWRLMAEHRYRIDEATIRIVLWTPDFNTAARMAQCILLRGFEKLHAGIDSPLIALWHFLDFEWTCVSDDWRCLRLIAIFRRMPRNNWAIIARLLNSLIVVCCNGRQLFCTVAVTLIVRMLFENRHTVPNGIFHFGLVVFFISNWHSSPIKKAQTIPTDRLGSCFEAI